MKINLIRIFKNSASNKARALVALSALLLSQLSVAHFQLLYTPELMLEKGGKVDLRLPFTHPAASGHVMTVEKPLAFYSIKRGKKTDLFDTLTLSEWTSAENSAPSYDASIALRGLGDNVLIYEMAPYYEESEDIYIQQITKTIVNVGGLPTDWSEDLNLSAEIIPLTKPYSVIAGSNFAGIVRSEGKPVPFAEIEIEYMNYLPQMDSKRFEPNPQLKTNDDMFHSLTIFTNADGYFSFTVPYAGQWGFAALGVGSQKSFKGKELSQDAVLWIQAHEAQLNTD